VNKEFQTYMG